MKCRFLIAWIIAVVATQAPLAVAQLPDKESSLQKVFGINWASDRATLIEQFRSRPGIKQEKDFKGNPLFSGGELLGHPAAMWGLEFFGDRLIGADVKLKAPGDVDKFYDEWQKKLATELGPVGIAKRDGAKRTFTWKTPAGGASGKGEIVVLQSLPKPSLIQILVHDSELSKPR